MRKLMLSILMLTLVLVSGGEASEIKMDGLYQTWWAFGEQSDGGDELKSEILVRRSRLGLTAKLNDRLTGRLLVGDVDDIDMIDAHGTVAVHKQWAKVRAGRFKYDFDIEARSSSKATAFPTRASVATALGGLVSEGRFRMQGVQIMGKGPVAGGAKAGYALGIFTGQSKVNEDDQYAYLLNLNGEPIPGLLVNAGYLTEETSPDDKDTAWVVGSRFLIKGLGGGAEYYSGTIETAGSEVKPKGYYVFVTYRIQDVELGARYASYDTDAPTTGSDSELTSVDLKAAYYLGEGKGYKAPKITLLYEIRSADDGFSGKGNKSFDEKGSTLAGSDIGNVIILALSYPL